MLKTPTDFVDLTRLNDLEERIKAAIQVFDDIKVCVESNPNIEDRLFFVEDIVNQMCPEHAVVFREAENNRNMRQTATHKVIENVQIADSREKSKVSVYSSEGEHENYNENIQEVKKRNAEGAPKEQDNVRRSSTVKSKVYNPENYDFGFKTKNQEQDAMEERLSEDDLIHPMARRDGEQRPRGVVVQQQSQPDRGDMGRPSAIERKELKGVVAKQRDQAEHDEHHRPDQDRDQGEYERYGRKHRERATENVDRYSKAHRNRELAEDGMYLKPAKDKTGNLAAEKPVKAREQGRPASRGLSVPTTKILKENEDLRNLIEDLEEQKSLLVSKISAHEGVLKSKADKQRPSSSRPSVTRNSSLLLHPESYELQKILSEKDVAIAKLEQKLKALEKEYKILTKSDELERELATTNVETDAHNFMEMTLSRSIVNHSNLKSSPLLQNKLRQTVGGKETKGSQYVGELMGRIHELNGKQKKSLYY